MAKSPYRLLQESRVKVRKAKRAAEDKRIRELAVNRNRASMDALRLERLNKAKKEEREAKAWLAKEKSRKQALRDEERDESRRKRNAKVKKLESRMGKGNKKVGRAVDKGLRKLFKVGR